MQSYSGLIECSPPLSSQEVDFLNQWQNKLNTIYSQIKGGNPIADEELDYFLDLPLTKEQRWTICSWAYSPMIKWSLKGIEVDGSHEKGQFRPAILAYLHLFIGQNPVLTNSLYHKLNFLKEHTLNGIIDSYKDNDDRYYYNSRYNDDYDNNSIVDGRKHWLYVVENNIISSVEHCTVEEYKSNPVKYKKITKEDNSLDKFNKYFPPLYKYAQVAKKVYSNEKNDSKKENSRIKI